MLCRPPGIGCGGGRGLAAAQRTRAGATSARDGEPATSGTTAWRIARRVLPRLASPPAAPPEMKSRAAHSVATIAFCFPAPAAAGGLLACLLFVPAPPIFSGSRKHVSHFAPGSRTRTRTSTNTTRPARRGQYRTHHATMLARPLAATRPLRPLLVHTHAQTQAHAHAHAHARRLHTVLPLKPALAEGAAPFLSKAAVRVVAEDWQAGLLERLNDEVRNTDLETASVASTVAQTRGDRYMAQSFNLASLALNNSFFFSNLVRLRSHAKCVFLTCACPAPGA